MGVNVTICYPSRNSNALSNVGLYIYKYSGWKFSLVKDDIRSYDRPRTAAAKQKWQESSHHVGESDYRVLASKPLIWSRCLNWMFGPVLPVGASLMLDGINGACPGCVCEPMNLTISYVNLRWDAVADPAY